MKIISKVNRLVILLLITIMVFTGCTDPNGPQNSKGQNPPVTPPVVPPEAPFEETLSFEAELEDLYLILSDELRNRQINEYQITGNVIQICKATCRLPLKLTYFYGPGEYENCGLYDLDNYKEDDPVTIYLNGKEYSSSELDGGVYTDDDVFVDWDFRGISIRSENYRTFDNIHYDYYYDISKTVTLKFKFRGIESNELVFMFNQDLGNSSLLPDITGIWISNSPGTIGKIEFNHDGTGFLYLENIHLGNDKQQYTLTWKTYKEELSNILEISSSFFSGLQKAEYSISGNKLTTSLKLGTQGYTFTRQ